MALTNKQALFVSEYLLNPNATEAARKAGYSQQTAAIMGSKNLKTKKITDRIASEQQRAGQATGITLTCLLQDIETLKKVAMSEITDKNGHLTLTNFTAALKALELQCKLLGLDKSAGEQRPTVIEIHHELVDPPPDPEAQP